MAERFSELKFTYPNGQEQTLTPAEVAQQFQQAYGPLKVDQGRQIHGTSANGQDVEFVLYHLDIANNAHNPNTFAALATAMGMRIITSTMEQTAAGSIALAFFVEQEVQPQVAAQAQLAAPANAPAPQQAQPQPAAPQAPAAPQPQQTSWAGRLASKAKDIGTKELQNWKPQKPNQNP